MIASDGGGGGRAAGLDAVAVVGATATGKSAVAVALAEELGGEVISVDSRQAYRGMAVGTAAPGPDLRARVPHHGVGFLEPEERYGAGEFARRARGWIEAIEGRGRVPVLAGGTGLFLRALTDPVFREPAMDDDRRARLEDWLVGLDEEELRRWTRRLDPALAEELDALDPQRCCRTLELALLSGHPLSWWQEHGPPEAPPVRALTVVLELGPDRHRERIRIRTERQLREGWLEEVRRLFEEGFDLDDPPFSALGYREVASVLAGEATLEEAAEEISARTWQYARRQRTWFRHQLSEPVLRLDAARPADDLVAEIAERWREEVGKA